MLVFELDMPQAGSWNGQWSGAGQYRAIVKEIIGKGAKTREAEILKGSPYTYDFGDGWVARITVRRVIGHEATRARKRSVGFAGYDWMVTSIIKNGKIVTE